MSGLQFADIRWISQDFLITGHRRIKDHLTDGHTVSANGRATENATVFENQDGGSLGTNSQVNLLRVAGMKKSLSKSLCIVQVARHCRLTATQTMHKPPNARA